MMRSLQILGLGLTLLLTMPMLHGHDQEAKKRADEPAKKGIAALMQRKLEHSQKVLQGIAIGDFDMIAKHADELSQISKAAEWRVVKSPQFELHSNEFRRNSESLVKAAKEKNLDAATLAYVDMTLNCVKCHKYLRERRETQGESSPTPVRLAP